MAFWSEKREQEHIANRRCAREQHHEPVDAETLPARRRQSIFKRVHIVVIYAHGLAIAFGTPGFLGL